MKVQKLLFKIPYYLLLIGVVSMGVLLLATLVPVPGNFKVKIVKSGSMEPSIMTGGIVIIKPSSSYKVGDIITFGLDTKTAIPTTHRIVSEVGSENSKVFTTKGDANDTVDSKTTNFSEVDCKVLFTFPYIGFILDFARKPLGFVLLVGVPALIVICDELIKIWREIIRLRNKKKLDKKVEKDKRQNVVDLRVQRNIMEPKNSTNFDLKILLATLVIIGSLLGLSSVGNTISYYNESEDSTGNTLQASFTYGELIVEPPLALSVPDVILTTRVGDSVEEELIETVIIETMSDEITNAGDEVVEEVEGEEKKEVVEEGEIAPEADASAE